MKTESKNNSKTFKELLWESGFTDNSLKGNEEIAEYLNVTPRTIRRWIKDNNPSKLAVNKLEDKNQKFNHYWKNFRFYKDLIITPNGYKYSAKELENLAIKIQLLKSRSK